MLADQLDYVVGVDSHRDSHALAVVDVVTGAVVFEATVAATSGGYADAPHSSTSTRTAGASSRSRAPALSAPD
jgi:hypothetical protein